MARMEQLPKVNLEVRLILTEAEVGALDALAGYGTDAFLKVFYQHMGEHYMKPHEAGLRSLFATARGMGSLIGKTAEARKVFDGSYTVTRKLVEPEPAPTLWQRLRDRLLPAPTVLDT